MKLQTDWPGLAPATQGAGRSVHVKSIRASTPEIRPRESVLKVAIWWVWLAAIGNSRFWRVAFAWAGVPVISSVLAVHRPAGTAPREGVREGEGLRRGRGDGERRASTLCAR